MKLFTERCFSTILLFAVLVYLCASLPSIKHKEDELAEGMLEAAIERDIQMDEVEKREPKKGKRKRRKAKKLRKKVLRYLRPNMDLFDVNLLEKEEILHHDIHPEEDKNDYVAQGDILFKPGEENQMFLKNSTENSTDAENGDVQNDALRSSYSRWPTTIPYVNNYLDQRILQRGFDEYEAKTCLRFRPRNRERDYMNFIRDDGCFSSVGRRGGAQEISIGYGCECKSTVVHEIMHALGFFHEQARPDRDNYVRVLYENVVPEFQINFAKVNPYQVTYFNTRYDYNSVMHYKNNEFSIRRYLNTIEAKDDKNRILGKVNCNDGLSELDVVELNRMYCSGGNPQPGTGVAPAVLPLIPDRPSPTNPPRTRRPRPRPSSYNFYQLLLSLFG